MALPIGVILQQWADLGIFYYVLPFLLVFALVYAILYKINIMGGQDASDNRGVYAIIALAIALMSLQFDFVPVFFQILFPKVGVGLSIILMAMILVGLFLDFRKSQGLNLAFLGGAGVIGLVILLTTFENFSWWTGSFWLNRDNLSAIVAGIIIVVLVLVIVNSGKTTGTNIFYREVPGNVR
ncbi:MAG: hypothetical protein QXI33_00545 [Candidatus Pacearchaeota archaeon]